MLLCRVVPLFRAYTGYHEDEEDYQGLKAERDEEIEEADLYEDLYDEGAGNFGRPLQPAQQLELLTTEPGARWALLVSEFSTCAESMNE